MISYSQNFFYSYFIYSVGNFMPYRPQISSLALYRFPLTFYRVGLVSSCLLRALGDQQRFLTDIVIMFLLPNLRNARCEIDLHTVSRYSD
jgi:hypothetical protein